MNSISGVTIPAGVVQLRHAFARSGAFWRQQAGKAQRVQTVVGGRSLVYAELRTLSSSQSLRASIHGWRSFANPAER